MPGLPEVSRLEARRMELTAQSAALRRGLQADWAKLEPWVGRVETVTKFARKHRLVAIAGAALTGIWAARRFRSSSGAGAKIAIVWRFWRKLSSLVR